MPTMRNIVRTRRAALLLGAALAFVAVPTAAQQAERAVTPDRPTMSEFGKKLNDQEAGALLSELGGMVDQALAASRTAESAATVADLKQGASRVVELVWGVPTGVAGAAPAPIARPGWKERWQVSGEEFDPAFVARLGSAPPRVTDVQQLGIVGRGLAVRARLEQIADGTTGASAAVREAAENSVSSLNNVIGWTHISRGYKGREIQPRISLTHQWDAPPAFWNSTADTGWLYEAESQAINILKTDYANDIAEARTHVAALTVLLQRLKDGVDANRNGTIEPTRMEGGLNAALSEAGRAGLRPR